MFEGPSYKTINHKLYLWALGEVRLPFTTITILQFSQLYKKLTLKILNNKNSPIVYCSYKKKNRAIYGE